MCAIAGLINCGEPALLQRMMDVMAHRGPDSQGREWFARFNSGFGHCRLAILDLSPTGHQPMVTPSGRYWITFNGEIYNFQELQDQLRAKGCQFKSTGDTEVILHAYEQWGVDCLKKFNGMFAFAIFDTHTGQLFAARDQIGIKPFYYHQQGECLVFASEVKGILQCPFVERRPNYEALLTPARFQISPHTAFEGIWKLPPAHYLTFADGQLKIERYWRLEPNESDDRPDAALIDEMDALLKDAVRFQMIADRPVGTFLSGGLDSSIISALMRQNTTGDIHAFTIKFSEADQKYERMPDDSFYARKVADQLGFSFHEFELQPAVAHLLPKMVWHLDEPLSDPATINTYMISKAARDLGIIVLLNGVGGDEIFGGYRKHLACLKAELYQDFVPERMRAVVERMARRLPVANVSHGFKYLRWFKRFASFASLPQAERYLASDLSLSAEQFEKLFPGQKYHDTYFYRAQQSDLSRSDLSYLTRMCLNDTHVFLPEHNLTYSDKAAMAASIETRPPLTDYRLVERMFALPPRQRIRGNMQKYLLKKVAERYLPREIVHRPKAPFNSPLRAWIRGPLAGMVDDLLSESSLRARGMYHASYVRSLIENDRRGLEDNGMVIWTLLTFEIWFRTFFGANGPGVSTTQYGQTPTVQIAPNDGANEMSVAPPVSRAEAAAAEEPGYNRNLEDQLYPLLSVYERLPERMKRVSGSVYRRLPQRLRLGARYAEFKELTTTAEVWSPAQIEEYQLKHLRAVLVQAGTYCPFYQQAFARTGFHPEEVRSAEDLKHCPLLEKQDLTEHLLEMVSTAFPVSARLYLTTGGSTGVPVGFYLEKGVSRPKEQAFLEAMWRRAGYFEGARLAVIRSHVTSSEARGRIASYDATRDWLMLSSSHLTPERLPEYLTELEKFKPDLLHAYPSAALQLAEYLEKAGQTWRLPLRGMLCGSERLTLPQKRLLERVFKCRVYRWYGHAERVVLAGEGRKSELFYFWPQYGFVEFGPPDAEGLCEVIGTSFHNLVMPLIRYRTGDSVRLADPKTDGELEFPWAAATEIAGREQEFLVSANGRRISLTAFNMHDAIFDNLYAVQFYQDQPGRAEFRYVAGPQFHTSRLAQIETGIRRKLGDDFQIEIRAVKEVEKTARGKHRWLVSKL